MSGRVPSSSERKAATVAVILIATVTVLTHLRFLGGGEIDWDEGVYWLSMQSMHAGHPLFSAVYSSQPPAFLLLTEPLWALFGTGIAAARSVMLVWSVIGLAAAGVIGWRLGGPLAAVAAPALLAVDPVWIRESVVLQADGPASAWALVGVALGAVAATSRTRPWSTWAAALAGAAVAVGVLTKLVDVAAGPPLLGLLLASPQRRRLAFAAACGGLLTLAAFLLPLHSVWGAIWDQAVGLHVNTHSVTYGETLGSVLGQRWYLAAIAAVGMVIGWRRRRRLIVTGVLWFAAGVLAIAATHPLWPHHAVTVSPGLALLGAAGISAGVSRVAEHPAGLPSAVRNIGLVVVSVGVFAALLSAALSELHAAPGSTAIVDALQRRTPRAAVLGDEQFDQALAHRPAPPQFVDTSVTRLIGSGVTAAQLESALHGVCTVLFATGRLASVTGFEVWVADHYTVRIDLGAGRSLYLSTGCRS